MLTTIFFYVPNSAPYVKLHVTKHTQKEVINIALVVIDHKALKITLKEEMMNLPLYVVKT